MSYLNRVEIEWHDEEEKRVVDADRILERARVFVQEQDIKEDVLADLRTALEGPHNEGLGFNRMYCDLIVEMLLFVSRSFSATDFTIRGTGEELLDTWVREMRNGEVTLSHGPWVEM